MTKSCMAWEWMLADSPAVPEAALAWGQQSRLLHARLERLPDDQRHRLQVTANGQMLIVTGKAEDLPWIEGIEYAAANPDAPGLWLPTRWRPDLAAELVLRALGRVSKRSPLLLWREPVALVPLDRLLPASTQVLAKIAGFWQEHRAT